MKTHRSTHNKQRRGASPFVESTLFLLDDASWEAFMAALDQPAKERSALRRLLTEPGRLDRE